MPESIEPKLIYLTRRNPAFARSDWTRRWRTHGALGMSMPRWGNVARYVHTDLIEANASQRDYLSDHDGVGMVWHRSIAHRDAHFADTSSQAIMVRDELETFARPIALDCCSTRELVLQPPLLSQGSVKLFMFLWSDIAVDAPTAARGHIRNLPLPAPAIAGWGLDCASIEEYWFDDVAAANSAARALSDIDSSLLCIGRDTELFRR